MDKHDLKWIQLGIFTSSLAQEMIHHQGLLHEPETHWEWPGAWTQAANAQSSEVKNAICDMEEEHLSVTWRKHPVSKQQSRSRGRRVLWMSTLQPMADRRVNCAADSGWYVETAGGAGGTLHVCLIPWLSSPRPQASSHSKSLSDTCQERKKKRYAPSHAGAQSKTSSFSSYGSHRRVLTTFSKSTRRYNPGPQDIWKCLQVPRRAWMTDVQEQKCDYLMERLEDAELKISLKGI